MSSSSNLLCMESPDFLHWDDDSMVILEYDSLLSGTNGGLEEESIDVFLELEGKLLPVVHGYLAYIRSRPIDAGARKKAVEWILQVSWEHGFMPLTCYLAVNYMDRFMSLHDFPEGWCWQKQLTCVACLSLAMKMEESVDIPPLQLADGNGQVSSSRFLFECKDLLQAELEVMKKLGWKLRSVTPFDFIESFISKIDPSRRFAKILEKRSTEFILRTTLVVDFGDFLPSSIAAAAVLCAAAEIEGVSQVNHATAASWGAGMEMESINNCFRLMQQKLVEEPEVDSESGVSEPESPVTVLHPDDDSLEYVSDTSETSAVKRRRLQ